MHGQPNINTEEGVERDQNKLGTGFWEKDNENIKIQCLLPITDFPLALFSLQNSKFAWNFCAFPKSLKFRYWDFWMSACIRVTVLNP